MFIYLPTGPIFETIKMFNKVENIYPDSLSIRLMLYKQGHSSKFVQFSSSEPVGHY